MWFFFPNNDFLEGNRLTQDPLWAFKVHIIRSLKGGNWLAASAGYGIGGVSYVNGIQRDTRISTFRFSLTYAIPFKSRHTARVIATSGRRLEKGPDFDNLGFMYQYSWISKQ